MTTINIAIAVDSVGALSAKQLDGFIFMMDDSIFGSSGNGTSHLMTACCPGQVIKWRPYAVDLQTPVSVKGIEFIGTSRSETPNSNCGQQQSLLTASMYGQPSDERTSDLKEWVGIVPAFLAPDMNYLYRVVIQMGTGKNSVMAIDTPALRLATGIQTVSAMAKLANINPRS